MDVYWDELIGRYRDGRTGRLVSWGTVKTLVNSSLRISTNVADTLASWVSNGQISVQTWEQLMKDEIKQEYIRQYLAAIGGRAEMTAQDWGRVGGMISDQYRYLINFTNDVTGGVLTEAQIKARANMYINSSREAFFKARSKVARKIGCDEVKWVLNPQYENCADCIYFSSLGWQQAEPDPFDGAFPGTGGTLCLTNCKCGMNYRNSENGKEYGEW